MEGYTWVVCGWCDDSVWEGPWTVEEGSGDFLGRCREGWGRFFTFLRSEKGEPQGDNVTMFLKSAVKAALIDSKKWCCSVPIRNIFLYTRPCYKRAVSQGKTVMVFPHKLVSTTWSRRFVWPHWRQRLGGSVPALSSLRTLVWWLPGSTGSGAAGLVLWCQIAEATWHGLLF